MTSNLSLPSRFNRFCQSWESLKNTVFTGYELVLQVLSFCELLKSYLEFFLLSRKIFLLKVFSGIGWCGEQVSHSKRFVSDTGTGIISSFSPSPSTKRKVGNGHWSPGSRQLYRLCGAFIDFFFLFFYNSPILFTKCLQTIWNLGE